MKKIVLATSNRGKIREFKEVFKNYAIQIISSVDLEVPEIEESAPTFVENALIKARHATAYTGLPALADDSGLVVDALQGEPGIHSARYALNDTNFANNIQKLLYKLSGVPFVKRSARFYCVLVYLPSEKDPSPIICEGKWEGFILEEPKGELGFGYDPVFYVPTHKCTAAQLEIAKKNKISHRGQAIESLLTRLNLKS
jgi:XTP/dITP diphosphohydrolase